MSSAAPRPWSSSPPSWRSSGSARPGSCWRRGGGERQGGGGGGGRGSPAADESEQVHRRREFRNWIGRDGAVCFSGRLTADASAGFLAAVEERKAAHVKAAHREQRREPFEAYAADALVELVTEERGVGA